MTNSNLLLYLSVYPLQDGRIEQTKQKPFEEQQNNYAFEIPSI